MILSKLNVFFTNIVGQFFSGHGVFTYLLPITCSFDKQVPQTYPRIHNHSLNLYFMSQNDNPDSRHR